MKKNNKLFLALMLLSLCGILSGCKTFTNKGLIDNNREHFREGFLWGRVYQIFDNLENIMEETNKENKNEH